MTLEWLGLWRSNLSDRNEIGVVVVRVVKIVKKVFVLKNNDSGEIERLNDQ